MRSIATVLGAGLAAVLTSPASAVSVSLGTSAPIEVYGTAGACATVTAPGLFAGQFSAYGMVSAIVQDGVVVLVPIAGTQPFAGRDSTRLCIDGAPTPASGGSVVYAITVTSASGDYVEVLACRFGNGAPACGIRK